MENSNEKDMREAQADRMTVKREEVEFLSEEELSKLGIKFYDNQKHDKSQEEQ